MSSLEGNTSLLDIERQVDQLYEQADLFAKSALADKVFSPAQANLLHSNESIKPEHLFGMAEAQRPLVVAFFGGTGVGKSTLLNRFAEQSVARTGIERPTSREVTIFVHRSVEIKQLPKDFPLDKVNIRQHQDETKRQVMWVDMPDIDSVETENLEIVRDWVPYIDVLLYVVSPERYRDDRGWQFLLDQGYKHAWLFVINQWDQGDEKVSQDFDALLQQAGFEQPLMYRTDCLSAQQGKTNGDDFDELTENLLSLADKHIINELDRRGTWNRVQALQSVLQQQAEFIGKPESFELLEDSHARAWAQTSLDLQQHFELPIQRAAMKFSQPSLSLFERFKSSKKASELPEGTTDDSDSVWDSRGETMLQSVLDKLILDADNLGLSLEQLKEGLNDVRLEIEEKMNQTMQAGLQQGLANPGNRLHRLIHKVFGALTTLLPVLALSWIAYRVISIFYTGEGSLYLGANFAIHSCLLTVVAWLIPYLLHKKMQPSVQKAAKKGLENGLSEGLSYLEVKIDSILSKNKQLQLGFLNTATGLIKASASIRPMEHSISDTKLTRMLQKNVALRG